ncbi:carbamoyltransferase HypF [bacterium]|nr:carbamoyltransferase HypF [bacterium]
MHQRFHIILHGAVQGVGFRPFVFNLAKARRISGFVTNTAQGVSIEAEGDGDDLQDFLLRLSADKPKLAVIQSLEYSVLDPVNYQSFEIRESASNGHRSAFILPDIATCPDCLTELWDPYNRRHLYPFINCTHCGPRFSIIEQLPYDRPNTTMKNFIMCPECLAEYNNPLDRRFHAQPTACPVCGPQVRFTDHAGHAAAAKHTAMVAAAEAILNGKIVAVKGLGGYQLLCLAENSEAVHRLRQRKRREEKPFAVMAADENWIHSVCEMSPMERRLLRSTESPIVLLRRREMQQHSLEAITPFNAFLGVMMPYTPLHHVLMHLIKKPVVCTSGNVSEEPICIDDHEALTRLKNIADCFLIHDRPIRRHVDDSVVRWLLGRELVLRRARGYVPMPVPLESATAPVLAVGGHLKNTVALSFNGQAFISQHIGDLSTTEAYHAFTNVAADLIDLYDTKPAVMAADEHPEYLSTKFAREKSTAVMSIQHHEAHVAGCYAENKLSGKVLGVAWDGTGLGSDGTIWGGEFFEYDGHRCKHAAQLRPFLLPGGEMAIREPRRAAMGLLFSMAGESIFEQPLAVWSYFTEEEKRIFQTMLVKNIRTVQTSSAGRLFDAIAAILGLASVNSYEGQAAMRLEYQASGEPVEPYPFHLISHAPILLDWKPMAEKILDDLGKKSTRQIAAAFHETLAVMILRVAEELGRDRVVLSGGCFQNGYLLERTVHRIQAGGRRVYWHQRVPPNDGGLSYGQAAYAAGRHNFTPENTEHAEDIKNV